MDVLTFISNIVVALAWPLFLTGLLLVFRKPIEKLLSSIRSIKYRDTEIEMRYTEIEKVGKRDVEILASALQYGPHSFQTLRTSPFIDLTDDEFNTIIQNNPKVFTETMMIKKDESSGKTVELNGVKLTKTAVDILETEYFGSGSGTSYGSDSDSDFETGTGTGTGTSLPFGTD